MQILSPSNIINNPPPIPNNPMGECFAEIVDEYNSNEDTFCKAAWRKEKRMDNFMTCLLVGTLGVAAFALGLTYKKTKQAVLIAIDFAADKAIKAKNYIRQNFQKLLQKIKK